MKVYICCSKAFFKIVPEITRKLEALGHQVATPDIDQKLDRKQTADQVHNQRLVEMLSLGAQKILNSDAILVLNLDKPGRPNYIGGSTFIEIYLAFDSGKKIFLYNNIPQGILHDEILAFGSTVIKHDLALIK